MVLLPVTQLKIGDYIIYYDRLHIIKNITNTTNFINIILRGIYLPYTIIVLISGPLHQIETVNPVCNKYKVISWEGNDKFTIFNMSKKEKYTQINIPEYSEKISNSILSDNPVYLDMCKLHDKYEIYSIY